MSNFPISRWFVSTIKKNLSKLFLAVGLFFSYKPLKAQTLFWQDNFENASTPDIAAGSTRTPSFNGGTTTSYFKRSNNTAADISLQALFGTNYAAMNGSFIWAGEDHDTPTGNALQQIEWTGINISTRTNLQFRGNFAANNTNGAWDNVNTGSTMAGFGNGANTAIFGNDYFIVEYAIDAGSYITLFSFWGDDIPAGGTPTSNKSLDQDNDGNFIGEGTTLNNTLTEFIKSIPGTGNVMKIRISVYSNGGSEEWAIDNFRLYSGAVLPVRLTSFNGTNTPLGVKLNWETESEFNSSRYEVERSKNGLDFISIGIVAAARSGKNSYNFTDNARPSGDRYYYRLRMIDTDNRFTYSHILLVKPYGSQQITVYPNPSKDIVNISFGTFAANIIRLYDCTGHLIYIKTGTSMQIQIDISKLNRGFYWLKVNENPLHKIIKE